MRGNSVNSTARLEGFTITAGAALGQGNDAFGGGIFLSSDVIDPDDQAPLIARCLITGNRAVNGGGMYTVDDVMTTIRIFPTVIDCAFIGNEAQEDGGAVYSGVKSRGTWTNCLFTGNQAGRDGAGLFIGLDGVNKTHDMVNCTFADNTADADGTGGGDGGGGGVFVTQDTDAVVTLVNCILWGNLDSGPQDETAQLFVVGSGGTVTLSFSDIQGTALPAGVTDGGGNVFGGDPLFVDPGAGNYRLGQHDSPCIDAGDDTAVPADSFDVNHDLDPSQPTPDLDVAARIVVGMPGGVATVDMGAYESCPWDCVGNDGIIGIDEFLYVLGNWGAVQNDPCDFNADGIIGIDEFLAVLGTWGPCGGPSTGVPQSVQDCIDRFGTEDTVVLTHCVCMFEPCGAGCPPDPECE